MDKLDAINQAKESLQVLEELLVEGKSGILNAYEVVELMSVELSQVLEDAMYAYAQNMDSKYPESPCPTVQESFGHLAALLTSE